MIESSVNCARVLDLEVTLWTREEWTSTVGASIQHNTRQIVMSQNLHSIYLAHREPALRRAQRLAKLRIDGMSVVALARLAGISAQREHRVTWNDWIHPLFEEAEARGWKIFHLGSSLENASNALDAVRQRYPKLSLTTHHGYFDKSPDSSATQAVRDAINEATPDILMVGMGMPIQEIWIADNHLHIRCPVILTCGAALEYVTGAQPTAPRWLGSLGLEWLHRLAADPKRLWRRYLLEPWYVGWLMLKSAFR